MNTRHKAMRLTRGDVWKIAGTLQNAQGFAVDLTAPAPDAIEWALFDASGDVKFTATLADGGITVTDAQTGAILIEIDPETTATVDVGSYEDRLRLTMDGDPQTMWGGPVEVEYSPFNIPPTP